MSLTSDRNNGSDEDSALMAQLRDNPRLLGNLLWFYYQQDPSDTIMLDKSIEATQKAIELTSEPGDHDLLFDFGMRLEGRLQLQGNPDDLNSMISAYQRALDLTPADDQDLMIRFNRLSASLYRRFKLTDALSDLKAAIETSRRAIELMLDSDINKPSLVSNHGGFLLSRFERTGDVEDLQCSISFILEAIELAPEDHPETPYWMTNLGNSSRSRFELTGDVEDLNRALKSHLRAVELTPDSHPNKSIWLNNLGITLLTYEASGDTGQYGALDLSISSHRRAIELSSAQTYDPARPGMHSNLGNALELRFARTGDLQDLEDAILSHRRACEHPEDNQSLKASRFHNLGNAFLKRFVRTRELSDVEASISSYRRAVGVLPPDHPNLPVYLINLSNALSTRYEHAYEIKDLGDAIETARRAVELTPDDDLEKPYRLGVLCSHLSSRYELTRELHDIECAVEIGRRALALTPKPGSMSDRVSNDLAVALWRRCEHFGDIENLATAIDLMRTRIEHTPVDHPYLVSRLRNLGGAQELLFRLNQKREHFDAAIQTYMTATQRKYTNPSIRLSCAISCISLHYEYPKFSSTEALLHVHSRVISLLPEFVWLGYDVCRRYEQSAGLGELVNAAASTAIDAGNLSQAIQWLEAGRSLIWFQVLTLRTPLDDLREVRPELAHSLEIVQGHLRSTASAVFVPSSQTFNGVQGIITDNAADDHRRHVIEHDKLLKEIRTCTDLEDFMLPAKFDSLIPSPDLANGPVIIINVHFSRCDALILYPGGTITPVHLPGLSPELANRMRSLWVEGIAGLRERCSPQQDGYAVHNDATYRHSTRVNDDSDVFHRLLEHLWTLVVSPVIQALEGVKPACSEDLIHVTWCPTGPLTQLPLHAAGIYSNSTGPRVYDSVVSSYTPSLSAFLRSCEGTSKHQPRPNVLIVSQPQTPGHTRLPGTTTEGIRLQTVLSKVGIGHQVFDDKEATTDSVKGVLGQYSWLHLACHGSQHRGDPTQSAFALYDGSLSLLDLMRTTAHDAELAFLSACQTATGDASNPEESAHLAAGMLAVGFKGVIATMWSIQDADAPIVVEEYYKELLALRCAKRIGRGQTGAAYALHKATKVLRENVGEDNFMRWVPFVHFGV